MKNIDLFNEILKYEEENENLLKERHKIAEKIKKNTTSIVKLKDLFQVPYNNEELTILAFKTLEEVKEILEKYGYDLFCNMRRKKDPEYKVLKNKYIFYNMVTIGKKFIFDREWKLVDNEYITSFPTETIADFADMYLDVYDIDFKILF